MRRILVISLSLMSLGAMAGPCKKWDQGQVLGQVDVGKLNEVSGMAYHSEQKKLYMVNDSGSGPYVFSSSIKGEELMQIDLLDSKFKDVEDLSIGPCGNEKCLYIADVGNNIKRRKWLRVFIYPFSKNSLSPKLKHKKKFKYPEGRFDSEAVAVHPKTGDLYLLTKERKFLLRSPLPSKLYRLSRNSLWSEEKSKLSFVRDINLEKISGLSSSGLVPTAMEFSSDGKSLLLLTYEKVFVFYSTNGKWNSGDSLNATSVSVKVLEQQEAATFLESEKSFVYNTESKKKIPLINYKCIK